jgi:hypothetical protein
MLDCVIAGVSQDMDFDRNVTTTFLLIRLPDGKQLRAAIDDEAAAHIVGMSVARNGQPTSTVEVDRTPQPTVSMSATAPTETWPDYAAPEPERAQEAQSEEAAPRIFGGQDGGDDAFETAPEPPQPKIVSPSSNVQRLPNGKIIVPSRRVPMDTFGYPIVPGAGVNPSSLTSQTNTDEDGIGSV